MLSGARELRPIYEPAANATFESFWSVIVEDGSPRPLSAQEVFVQVVEVIRGGLYRSFGQVDIVPFHYY
jgi:hypothetical protein